MRRIVFLPLYPNESWTLRISPHNFENGVHEIYLIISALFFWGNLTFGPNYNFALRRLTDVGHLDLVGESLPHEAQALVCVLLRATQWLIIWKILEFFSPHFFKKYCYSKKHTAAIMIISKTGWTAAQTTFAESQNIHNQHVSQTQSKLDFFPLQNRGTKIQSDPRPKP